MASGVHNITLALPGRVLKCASRLFSTFISDFLHNPQRAVKSHQVWDKLAVIERFILSFI